MKRASDRVAHFKFSGHDKQTVADLKNVADAFASLQEARHIADYDSSRKCSRTEALEQVNKADTASKTWSAIRNEAIAQDYLLSLLTGRP